MLRSFVFFLLAGTSVSYAQIRSGAIVGTVLDPSGSPIPEANVDVVAEETNFSYTAKTNVAGDYTVPYLSFGSYTVTISKKGFNTFRITGINVRTAQTVRADSRLELSTVTTAIEVSATNVELQTESGSVQ